MAEPLLPERLEELMAGYALGNLSPEEAEALQRLLAENPQHSTQMHGLQEVLELMPYALPETNPPKHLRSAIVEAAATGIKRDAMPARRSTITWSKIAGSVAAILVLALGLDDYLTRQQLNTIQAQVAQQKDVIAMLQDSNTHLVSLKGMDRAAAASGSIVMTPGEPKAVLILQNLPVLPEGQFYQLWAVINQKKIPTGQFNASSQGTVLVKFPLPSGSRVTALVVTLEASPAPVRPDGPMVMTSEL